jgi:trimeric autotransporter adhesin
MLTCIMRRSLEMARLLPRLLQMGQAIRLPVKQYRALIVLVCLSVFVGCGAGTLGPGVGAPSPARSLVSIAIAPANAALLLGTLQQFTATGTYSDHSSQDLTDSVTWSSSDISVASIAGGGLATALTLGSVTVSATSGSVTGSTTVDVQAAVLSSITVRPVKRKIAQLTTAMFQAIGAYTDGSTHNVTTQVSWTSSNTAVATIGGNGRAKALTPGSTTLTATLGSISGSGTLDVSDATIVSVSVTPPGRTIAQDTRLTFVATGTFSDHTTQVITVDCSWASDNPVVATVGAAGTATAISPGTANISASFTGVSGTAPLNVSSATLSSISVTPASAVLAPTTSANLVATGTYSDGSSQVITNFVTWTSSAADVASVSNVGEVTAQSAGNVTIIAQLGSLSANCAVVVDGSPLTSIRVSPQTASIPQQTEIPFAATGIFADGNTQDLTTSVLWTSSPASVATISNLPATMGQAIGEEPGTATITALFGGQIGMATLTITSAMATSLRVSAAATSLEHGGSTQFTALAEFSDGTTKDVTSSVTWTSSDASVAIVTPTGVATSTHSGMTIVTAATNDLSGTAVLAVY